MGLFSNPNYQFFDFKQFIGAPSISTATDMVSDGSNLIISSASGPLRYVDRAFTVRNGASFSGAGSSVTFGRGRAVIGTVANGGYYTDDAGVTMTPTIGLNSGASSRVNSIRTSGNGAWFAATDAGARYSTDGVTWMPSIVINPSPDNSAIGIKSVNICQYVPQMASFVLVGGNSSGGFITNRVSLSVDGNDWAQTIALVDANSRFRSVAFYQDRLFIGCFNGEIYSVNKAISDLQFHGFFCGNFPISSFTIFNGRLYAGTGATNVNDRGYIGVFNGATFDLLYSSNSASTQCRQMTVFNRALVCCGFDGLTRTNNQLPN